MKKVVVDRIVRATCSDSLFAAIKKSETVFSDFDLLALTHRFSRDFRTRLELLQLIEIKTQDEFVQARAARALAYEKSKLERFSLDEENCFYKVSISIRTHLPSVNFLAKTYSGVLNAVGDYYDNEVLEFDDSSRFTVTKLVADKDDLSHIIIAKDGYIKDVSAGDNMSDCPVVLVETTASAVPKGFEKSSFEDLYEDIPKEFQGEAHYKGEFLLTDIVHIDLRDNTVLATDMGCIDQDCTFCKSRPCLLFYAPKLPQFLSDFDLAYYFNRKNERIYGVVLVSLATGMEDECAYFIPLFEIDEDALDTRDNFLQFAKDIHTFIEYPLLERVCERNDAPQEVWENLEAFIKLHKRFAQKK